MSTIEWQWLGRQPYQAMWEQQRRHRTAVINGEASEVVWLLEHEPTITTGRRTVANLPEAERLAAEGIELFHTERGGLATYHGPGQLMVYAIINCWERGLGAKMAVRTMERAIMDWLLDLSIAGSRRDGLPGIWVGADKIAAIGMHFSQGVSMHGAAIYLSGGSKGFELITPCGVTDGGLTSIRAQRGNSPSAEDAAPAFMEHLLRNLADPECLRPCGEDAS